jgi:hypothetical protein
LDPHVGEVVVEDGFGVGGNQWSRCRRVQ